MYILIGEMGPLGLGLGIQRISVEYLVLQSKGTIKDDWNSFNRVHKPNGVSSHSPSLRQ